jgi:hypothetical protein
MSTIDLTYVPIFGGSSFIGSGPESIVINRLTRQAYKPLITQSHVEAVIDDLHELRSEARAGKHESKLDDLTFALALRFLLAFPKALPSPELTLDNDGEVSFDWLGKNHRIFSVSLRSDGRLSFAGRHGPKKRFYGIEEFENEMPERIVTLVKELVS